MSFLNKIKPNKPTATLGGYFITFHGKSKFGKTTFAIDLIKEAYDNDLSKALLLGCEIGYRTQAGVYAIPITDFDESEKEFDDDGEEIIDDDTTYGFIEAVDELVENKKTTSFKFIIIDTVTSLEKYAKKYVISERSRKDKKIYKDISDIPFGNGYNEVADVIYEQIDRLKKAGYGVLLIGHSKVQKKKLKNDFEYDYDTLDALGKVSGIIEKESDFIIYGDIVTAKSGKEGVKEERVLRFRSEGETLCGTRFRHFPETLPLDAKRFLSEFENAVLNLYDGNEDAVKEAKKNEEEVIEKKVNLEEVTVESVQEEIQAIVENLPRDKKISIAKEFKEILGEANFKASENVKDLQKALAVAKKYK